MSAYPTNSSYSVLYLPVPSPCRTFLTLRVSTGRSHTGPPPCLPPRSGDRRRSRQRSPHREPLQVKITKARNNRLSTRAFPPLARRLRASPVLAIWARVALFSRSGVASRPRPPRRRTAAFNSTRIRRCRTTCGIPHGCDQAIEWPCSPRHRRPPRDSPSASGTR
jgi:hypothetical protein